MSTVQLPPGFELPRRASDAIPYGRGRMLRPDLEESFYLARCEANREQNPTGGRKTVFPCAASLEHACNEYFTWIDEHPLFETQHKFSGSRGGFFVTEVPKKRPYTVGGLCIYLGVSTQTWDNYRRDERWSDVTSRIDEAIRNQKFEGAASGFFNPAIIARDLGLVDKQEVTGAGGGPIEKITTTMTPAEAAEAYAKTREK